ncbi:MAG: ORF6N domain-containing protein [Melioribacteraceae bacterium]|nr:ORF6N domain-containing protein [Melioribacteraceae bacterium]
MEKGLIKFKNITSKIYVLRNQKVMLDADLANLYGIETRVLKQAVRRNKDRFPNDFMFQLTKNEWQELITNCDNLDSYKFSPSPPFVFTEQGVAMLSSVLNSKRAIKVNIEIMRAFVKMREFLESHKELAKKLSELEKRIEAHDESIIAIFEAIKQLMAIPEKPQKRIGF